MTPHPVAAADTTAQARLDRSRVLRAFNVSLAAVLLLVAVFTAQGMFDWRAWAVAPLQADGLRGILTAPLLHGSLAHLGANAAALLILGTLAGSVYPRATVMALPLLWLGSGLGAWLLGEPGSRHLGASGVTHGLMFLVFVLGLLRRDRPAIATSMIAFLFYGGMLMTILPHEAGVSWQSHLGGAVAGLIAALLLRLRDPQQAKPRYSWEDEDEDAAWEVSNPEHAMLEPPPPRQVPVLWQRQDDGSDNVVLHFPPRERPPGT
ncbi:MULTISPECIES: rhomboid family intramembrane serine protease [Xanthomonas]|uniref:rhomboid family intramembrane serine protease n=1 Tax=Xanthomonas TaxID=338 RepID=UPI0004DFB342|nr:MULTISPECIES: rhomboid family intramembrane serine protease [Xanthomonas]OHX22178.1 rhomboid family intramembrane serine protease [Xanthomonas alfalfae]AYO97167.1 rhomboid family intramembrane serine protease [Xanthomonas axonopodis pv. commiphoreae]MBV6786257.1 rhomboid family intramembrane serine protease [Xanthomonas campestris pv. uppalii]MBV6830469.1 rhomboid family intramembrane serine protease [Xanthomonas campestris pv. viegasii]MBV6889075.1 rhomboid family intramembrane serine prot